jgi:hypothetical protein
MRTLRTLAPVAMSVGLMVSGCSNNAVFDLAPLGSFFDLRVENDTGDTVTISDCWGSKCQHSGGGFNDTLRPGAEREEAAWLNATPGVAAVRISRREATVGCLRLHYRKGQEHGQARVSEAAQC